MMRVSTKRILSIMFAIACFMGAILVYSTFIRGEGKVISEKRSEIASKANLVANEETAVDRVQNLIKQYKNVAALQQTVSLAIPAGSDTVTALHQIESIGKTSSVNVTTLKFSTSLPRSIKKSFLKRLGVLEVVVSATGNYANLKRFLQLLETGVRVFNVNSFKFQPSGGKEALETLSIVGEMYYQE